MKKLTRYPKKLLAACAIAAAATCGSALAEPVFRVQEGAIDGDVNLVTADRLTFGYNSRISQTINGGSLAGADDPFTQNGFLSKGSFELGAGNAEPSLLNAPEQLGGYGIYGIFQILGEADPFGIGGILATVNSVTMTLYADRDQNTMLGFDGLNTVTRSNFGDDAALANFTMIAAEAHIFGGLANGDFDSFLNMTLTPFGETYFVSPDPFYPIENFGGNIQTLTGVGLTSPNLTTSFVAQATGAGVELFQIPEPGMLSLFGLAALAMGAATRRHKKAA